MDGRLTENIVPDGGRHTRVLSAGEGRTLVWLHDTLGSLWSVAHGGLSDRFRVLAPTLPGFEDPNGPAGIDEVEDAVFWLLDLLEAFGSERPILLGCGLGGWIAAELAIRYSSRLAGLILVDAYGLRVDGALAADEYALTPPMLRPLAFADPAGLVAHQLMPDTPVPDRAEAWLRARVAGARLAWQFPYSRKLRSRLPRARVPALILWGEADRLVPVAHAHAYANGLPDAELRILAGAGHYPYAEAPDAFVETVGSWVSALP
jgi:pimeloyl-ACP methyl ester carboxylesterase